MDLSGIGGLLQLLQRGRPLTQQDYPDPSTYSGERESFGLGDPRKNSSFGNFMSTSPTFQQTPLNDPLSRLIQQTPDINQYLQMIMQSNPQ